MPGMLITTGVLPFLKDDIYIPLLSIQHPWVHALLPPLHIFFFETIYLFIYCWLSLACPCCPGFSPVAASGGYSPVAVREFLIAGTSLVVEL